MITRRAWRLVRILALGLSLTAAVAVIDYAGWLVTLEQFTYDQRVKHFQHWYRRPHRDLYTVIIDDQSIDRIGPWPWPRSLIAQLIDEMVRDGAAQLAFDIVWSKPVDPPEMPPGVPPPPSVDERLARSMADAAAAHVPVLLPIDIKELIPGQVRPTMQRAIDLMIARPEMSTVQLAAAMKLPLGDVEKQYYGPSLTAAFDAVARHVVHDTTWNDDQAAEFYFPAATRQQIRTPELGQFQAALRHARVTGVIEHRLQPMNVVSPDLMQATFANIPIGELTDVAHSFGFVNYLVGNDGRVRWVPLVAQAHDRVMPQFGLLMAAVRLGIDLQNPNQLELSPTQVILRPPGRPEIRVPVRLAETGNPPRHIGGLMDIPLRGNDDWKRLYDADAEAFIPALQIWQILAQQKQLERNLARVEGWSRDVLGVVDASDPVGTTQLPPGPAGSAGRLAMAAHTLDVVKAGGIAVDDAVKQYAGKRYTTDEFSKLDADVRLNWEIGNIAPAYAQAQAISRSLDDDRAKLSAKIRGKMLVFGDAESSAAADHVPTSIHADCPGVVLHGAIANAVLDGEMWTHLPRWYASVLTCICGVLITVAVTTLTPWRAFAALVVMLGVVFGVASIALFDYANIVIGLAGPLTAGTLCWAACTLVITLRERYDRAIVTRRFRSYVDPALVNYVLEDPDRGALTGETRELTVVFIDVAGFTTLAEKLGEKSIIILRQLMDAMVPIIRANGGFVNKFLGDGIMFFYGAPKHDADHAKHAVKTVLEMQQALGQINKQLVATGLPELGVRAGISTGRMVVGDAGSADASDYTVLGDAVNLGARLESANKALGTAALCTARTAELCGDDFLFVPLGRLLVVGKDEAVPVCEPVCSLSAASPEQHLCADAMKEILTHITRRQAVHALARLDQFRATGQRTKICDLLETLVADLSMDLADKDLCIRLAGK